MRIRIEGSPEACAAAADVLRTAFVVTNVSRPYPNRGGQDVRVYVEANDPPANPPTTSRRSTAP